jgi:Na+-driven multidrug efflux pump
VASLAVNIRLTYKDSERIMIDELRHRAFPLRPALLAMALSNALEAYFISSLGTETLVAFGMLVPVLLLFDALGIGLGAGASSFYARLSSAGGYRCGVVHRSLWLAFLLSTGVAVAIWLGRTPLLDVLGFNVEATPRAVAYLAPWLIGAVFLVVSTTACALLRAANKSRLAALSMITMAGLKICLSPLLIHGGLFFPSLGFSGGAVATAVAAAMGCSVSVAFAVRAGQEFACPRTEGPTFLHVWHRVLAVGIPAAFANVMIPVGAFLVVGLLSAQDAAFVAAFGMAVRIEALSLLGFYAYSSVAGPIFGERLIGQQPAELIDQVRRCAYLCLKRGALLAILLLPLPLILPLWPSACHATLPALQQYFWWVPLSYGAYGFVMVANAICNGIGRPLYGLLISFARCLGLLAPLAWLLGNAMGAVGVFVAISLSNVLAAGLAYRLLRRALANNYPALSTVPSNPAPPMGA